MEGGGGTEAARGGSTSRGSPKGHDERWQRPGDLRRQRRLGRPKEGEGDRVGCKAASWANFSGNERKIKRAAQMVLGQNEN
jgi:hypothetical protein